MALTRRDLLCNTAAGCASFAAAGLLAGCGFDVDPAPEISATADASGLVVVALSKVPQLSAVGDAVILKITGPGSGKAPEGGVLLVRREMEEFVAVSARCTHVGCPLGYSRTDRQIACPCHGSRFLAAPEKGKCTGAVLRGPARDAVSAFAVGFDAAAGEVAVDLASPAACEGVFVPTVVNGQVVLPFDKLQELASPGGSWVGQPQGLADTLIVVRLDQTTAIAVSAICTHMQCKVAYIAANGDLECPCHGSKFDLTGGVTVEAVNWMGPGRQPPLAKYTATLDAQAVTVKVA